MISTQQQAQMQQQLEHLRRSRMGDEQMQLAQLNQINYQQQQQMQQLMQQLMQQNSSALSALNAQSQSLKQSNTQALNSLLSELVQANGAQMQQLGLTQFGAKLPVAPPVSMDSVNVSVPFNSNPSGAAYKPTAWVVEEAWSVEEVVSSAQQQQISNLTHPPNPNARSASPTSNSHSLMDRFGLR